MMDLFRSKTIWGISLLILFGILAVAGVADDDKEKHRNRESRHNDNNHNGDEYLKPVSNSTYADQCGTCHFAYQPELLPAESWRLILDGTEDHFGDTVDLDQDARREIERYLTSNAANTSSAELSRKIMRSLAGRIPLRITNIPYIRKEHHELPPQVIKQPSVGAWGNCIVCHRNAENGDYDDDRVSVPQ